LKESEASIANASKSMRFHHRTVKENFHHQDTKRTKKIIFGADATGVRVTV
jgi:hypothetical protein